MGAMTEMEFGHGFLPRVDARNYKAVERRLPSDGPSLFHEGLTSAGRSSRGRAL